MVSQQEGLEAGPGGGFSDLRPAAPVAPSTACPERLLCTSEEDWREASGPERKVQGGGWHYLLCD